MIRHTNLRHMFMLVLINTIGCCLLYYLVGAYDSTLAYYFMGVTAMVVCSSLLISRMNWGDEYLLLIVSMLVSIGMIMLFRIDAGYGTKQAIWFGVSAICFYVTFFLYRYFGFWKRLIPVYLILDIVFFVLTLALAATRKGAKNWIVVGGFSVQPSELIRIVFILLLAGLITQGQSAQPHPARTVYGRFLNWLSKPAHLSIVLMVVTYIHLGFLVLQREWGFAVLFFIIYFVFLYISNRNLKFLAFNALVAGIGLGLGYKFMYHIQVRVDTWLRPFSYVEGKGYQITQSMFAIAEGGFVGRGLGQGNPGYIPEVYSDFIFAAICEEMGVLGGVAIIMLYFIFIYRGFKLALSVTNQFDKLTALGITVMFAFQTFIIIGGVIKFIPLTGITLPFISYGGSSLVTSFIALAILQAISCKKGALSDDIE